MCPVGGTGNPCSLWGKTLWHFLKSSNINPPCAPAILPTGVQMRTRSHESSDTSLHSRQTVRTSRRPVGGWAGDRRGVWTRRKTTGQERKDDPETWWAWPQQSREMPAGLMDMPRGSKSTRARTARGRVGLRVWTGRTWAQGSFWVQEMVTVF